MSARRTAWHLLFTDALRQRMPPGFVLRTEVPLGQAPRRLAVLLIRRLEGPRHDEEARILPRLWPLIEKIGLLEFKSAARPNVAGDLTTLVSYGTQFHADAFESLSLANLSLFLVIPTRNAALAHETAGLGVSLSAESVGLERVVGLPWRTYVVVLDEVSAADRDELLDFIATRKNPGLATQQWVAAHTHGPTRESDMSQLEDADDVMRALVQRTPTHIRLEGIPAKDRLEGLAPDEQLLAMSDDLLRRLPESFLATLPEHVQSQIRARLGH